MAGAGSWLLTGDCHIALANNFNKTAQHNFIRLTDTELWKKFDPFQKFVAAAVCAIKSFINFQTYNHHQTSQL